MAYASAGRESVLGAEALRYERHRPEQTLLDPLIEQHYPAFVAALAAEGREVPGYVASTARESTSTVIMRSRLPSPRSPAVLRCASRSRYGPAPASPAGCA